MTQDIYRTLQERLDTYSLGFPATETGIEITILKRLFTEIDVDLFLALSPLLETPDSIARRLGRPLDAISAHLEDMTGRGLLFRLKKGDTVKYGAIPFMHGIMEFQIKRVDRDLWQMIEEYFDAGFRETIAGNAESFLRIIPVQESIEQSQHIASFDDAKEILNSMKTIVVTDCMCRKGQGLLGRSCGKPVETCFMFGSMAQYYLDQGMGRQITTDEAIEILKTCRDAGLVTQPATSQNPSGMCNCCGDCCGVLLSLKIMDRPAEKVFSNHFAAVKAEICLGCEACIDHCQMEALRMSDDVVKVDLDRCIGCGLCITACSTNALSLQRKPDPLYRTPPATSMEQMMIMAQKRGLL
jgi:Na+-translocating ferredoxin:NAD+ oxidoreductase subunit B